MKNTCLLILFASLAMLKTTAQEINIKWSEKQIYDNKQDGFFSEFIGGNSKNIYAKFTNKGLRAMKKLNIVSFDKITMKKNGECLVVDYKNAKSADYKGLLYHKTLVFENVIYIFWKKESDKKEELYVQSYDAKLNRIKQLKKIYELNSSPKLKKPELLVMGNPKNNERVLIVGELSVSKDDDLKIEYKLLNSELSFESANQVKLPVQVKTKSESLTSDYELGDDGNLHVKTYISLPKEDRKNLKKGESYVYPLYSVVDLSSGETKSFPIKFENKNIFDFQYIADKNSIKLIGFFCDLQKDPGGNDIHGIFYSIIDNKSFVLQDVNFSYFTPEQLNKIFSKDIKDRKDNRMFSSKKKKQSEEESLASNYTIESIQTVQNNIVLFCSRMRNYTTRSCDGKGNCRTNYHCQKSNVTAFKLNSEGKILWASNLDRQITYGSWNVYDLKVIKDNEKYYVIYGSDYYTNEKTNKRMSKPRKYSEDNLEYAVFDNTDGSYVKKEYRVNALNTPRKEKKIVSATNIEIIDNKFYINATRIGIKLPWLIAGCVGAPCCFIPTYYVLLSGDTRIGTGFLGIVNTDKK